MVIPLPGRFVVTKDQLSCELAGEAAILNLKNGVYYGLDPIGARVWSLVEKPRSVNELVDALMTEYDVDRSQLEVDLRDLLTQLTEHGLLDVVP